MTVLIIGAGLCGLGTALLLARDGHDVTVLDRDASPLPASPEEAWTQWERPGVAQFRQPHNFMPGLRLLLEQDLPDVHEAFSLVRPGRYDLVNPLPRFFTDREPRPIDSQLWTYTVRRPVGEWVFATVAASDRRVSIRRGVKVTELLAGKSHTSAVPHVGGVRTGQGEELRADLVVDATGRQSRAAEWLQPLGARPLHEESADSGFVYYTRFFRGRTPERVGPTLMPIGTMSILTLPGDSDTWSVTVFTATGDQPLKTLRHEDVWTRVVRACPLQAHWLDGEPITPVLAMSGVVDRYRRFVVDAAPVVTGFVAVADAWACTNPSAGRGLTIGLLHGRQLRDALRESGGDPHAIVTNFDRRTEQHLAPWYDAQIALDRWRFAEMEALREQRQPPPPADGLASSVLSLLRTFMADPDLFRAALEYIATITPVQEIVRRPQVAAAMSAAQAAMKHAPPPRMPGPNREQLLALVQAD